MSCVFIDTAFIDIAVDNKNFANSTTISSDDSTIVAKKKNRSEFMGMVQLSVEDDAVVVRNLIIGNLFIVSIMAYVLFLIKYIL